MRRRSREAAWGLLLVWGLGFVAPAWAASWRERRNAGDFAERIAGVYLIRHHRDDGTLRSFRLISLTPWGTWGSTNSNQHDSLRPFRFSDQHGVWERTGWREITAEVVDFNLDGATGVHTDIVRVRYVVRFSKDLQSITGTQLGRVFPVAHEHDQGEHDPEADHNQDPFAPDALPSAQFSSTFTGQRITVGPESQLGPSSADDAPLVGLIIKTETNPFFVTMREGAREKAGELGVELWTFAGADDEDIAAQVRAIARLVAAGATGILLTPSDPGALRETVAAAQRAGVLVIALDTPFDPADAVDATFATDNFEAGVLIGRWARATLGDDAQQAKIVTLDLSASQITVDVLRNQGFLSGFGVDIKDPHTMYDEDDPRLVGSGATLGTAAGGRAALERLLRQEPGIDVVYTLNEPVAAGAYAALQAFGLEHEVLLVSIDGGCPGVENVATGIIGATAMQYPLRMAALGIEAVVEFARSGAEPTHPAGAAFHNTGVTLVTDEPVPGIPSISTAHGLQECWG